MQFLTSVAALAASLAALAQPTSTSPLANKPNGMRHADPTWVALANCTLHARPGDSTAHATIVLRDGRIAEVLPALPGPDGKPGTDDDTPAAPPAGARVYDCTGLHLYAAFIEPYLEIDVPRPDAADPGKHWNDLVTPQRSAASVAQNVAGPADALRKLGFGAACVSPRGGIFRGRSAVVSLAKPLNDENVAPEKPPLYRDDVYQCVAFETTGGYPDSQMGAIALIRQTLSDADWQRQARASGQIVPENCLDWLRPRFDNTIEGGWDQRSRGLGHGRPLDPPLLFDAADELEDLRAIKIAREFDRRAVLLGSGSEYKRLQALANAAGHAPLDQFGNAAAPDGSPIRPIPVILPLNFPVDPDVSSPGKIEQTDLRELMSWEQAPTNPRRLAAAGIDFALTTHRLKNRDQFFANLRRALAHGLTDDQALAALTTRPAELLGLADQLGTVEPGKRANLVLLDASFADFVRAKDSPATRKRSRVRDLWIDGLRHEISPPPGPDLEGVWTVDLRGAPEAKRTLIVDADNALTVTRNDKSVKAEHVALTGTGLNFTFDHEPLNEPPPKAEAPPEHAPDAAPAPDTGPKGVFSMSAVIERDALGRPNLLRGVGVRSTGERFDFTATRQPDSLLLGAWRVSETDGVAKDPAAKDQLDLTITRTALTLRFTFADKKSVVIRADDFKWNDATPPDALTFTHDLKPLDAEGKSSDSIRVEGGILVGESTLPDASKHAYKAARRPAGPPAESDDEPKDPALIIGDVPDQLGLPFGPYALDAIPPQETILFKDATIWTNTGEPLQHAWLLIEEGKVLALGSGVCDVLTKHPPREIDCAGKHITPGIIDCHSHTGISKGVNEAGRSVSAEVRIADVTNPDDVSWYRQLAGGVTSVNSLHGSANAIGGQSQTNKNRWGCLAPDDMHMEGAMPGIKFALGENPTQLNSGGPRSRYPITRMGVETLIRDRFAQAKEYAEATKARGAGVPPASNPSTPPRRDLQLEALAEILSGARIVHCHSYRQDEIVMLTRIAREFGFKIGTFQHILEGYKVADYVRDYSGGGSGFTDWWAYKIEVQDAIANGLPLMAEVGVTTSFNSDSDELARRLNVEAGKAVKYSYGRISRADALKFVTLNPAKQLQIDYRVGTLEPGRDADLVVWSGEPMSPFTKAERTFVDGRELFSLEQDAAHRAKIAAERARIIQKLLSKPRRDRADRDAASGTDASKPSDTPPGTDTPQPRRGRRRPPNEMTSGAPSQAAESDDEFTSSAPSQWEGVGGGFSPSPAQRDAIVRRRLHYLDLLRHGIDPDAARCGECGCGD